MPNEESERVDLRHYVAVFRRRWWIILMCLAVTASAALAASLVRTRIYEATATILVEQRTGDALFNPATGQQTDPQRAIDTEIQVIRSRPVEQAAEKSAGQGLPAVEAGSVTGTNVINVRVRSSDQALAARAADQYANAYLDFKRTKAVDDVLGAAKQVQQKIDQLQEQANALPAGSAQRIGIDQQVNLFQQQLDQLQVGAALKTGGVSLVARAEIPTTPVSPKPLRDTALAAAVGLLLGIGIAFVVDHFDDRIRSKEDFESAAPGIDVLGLIPAVPGWTQPSEEHLATIEMSASSIAEAYRSVRTAIQFLSLDNAVKILQVTSAVPGEGKTTTAANLAVVFSHAGVRTILIDGDLRRPRLHRFFGLRNDLGLTDVIGRQASTDSVIVPVPDNARLWMLTAGTRITNPSELLTSRSFQQVLESLEEKADLIIIDSPPILPVTDGLVVAAQVDATLLIATMGQTTRRNVRRTLELLEQTGAPLVGTVLNQVSEQDGYAYSRYGYGYGHGYGRPRAATRGSGTEVRAPNPR